MDYIIITKLFILQKKNLQMNAGLRIKKIREYRNFTQQYMADNLEISQNAYSKIENETTKMTTNRLEQIAKILDVPFETIINDEHQIFNLSNNHVDKFYIENLTEQRTELLERTIDILKEQLDFLKNQNLELIKLLEKRK
jgi:transcriptional regulator with XRE-family HTH domain